MRAVQPSAERQASLGVDKAGPLPAQSFCSTDNATSARPLLLERCSGESESSLRWRDIQPLGEARPGLSDRGHEGRQDFHQDWFLCGTNKDSNGFIKMNLTGCSRRRCK